MRYFQEYDTKSKSGAEKNFIVIMFTREETHLLHEAMTEYNVRHPKNKKYKALQKEMDNVVGY